MFHFISHASVLSLSINNMNNTIGEKSCEVEEDKQEEEEKAVEEHEEEEAEFGYVQKIIINLKKISHLI